MTTRANDRLMLLGDFTPRVRPGKNFNVDNLGKFTMANNNTFPDDEAGVLTMTGKANLGAQPLDVTNVPVMPWNTENPDATYYNNAPAVRGPGPFFWIDMEPNTRDHTFVTHGFVRDCDTPQVEASSKRLQIQITLEITAQDFIPGATGNFEIGQFADPDIPSPATAEGGLLSPAFWILQDALGASAFGSGFSSLAVPPGWTAPIKLTAILSGPAQYAFPFQTCPVPIFVKATDSTGSVGRVNIKFRSLMGLVVTSMQGADYPASGQIAQGLNMFGNRFPEYAMGGGGFNELTGVIGDCGPYADDAGTSYDIRDTTTLQSWTLGGSATFVSGFLGVKTDNANYRIASMEDGIGFHFPLEMTRSRPFWSQVNQGFLIGSRRVGSGALRQYVDCWTNSAAFTNEKTNYEAEKPVTDGMPASGGRYTNLAMAPWSAATVNKFCRNTDGAADTAAWVIPDKWTYRGQRVWNLQAIDESAGGDHTKRFQSGQNFTGLGENVAIGFSTFTGTHEANGSGTTLVAGGTLTMLNTTPSPITLPATGAVVVTNSLLEPGAEVVPPHAVLNVETIFYDITRSNLAPEPVPLPGTGGGPAVYVYDLNGAVDVPKEIWDDMLSRATLQPDGGYKLSAADALAYFSSSADIRQAYADLNIYAQMEADTADMTYNEAQLDQRNQFAIWELQSQEPIGSFSIVGQQNLLRDAVDVGKLGFAVNSGFNGFMQIIRGGAALTAGVNPAVALAVMVIGAVRLTRAWNSGEAAIDSIRDRRREVTVEVMNESTLNYLRQAYPDLGAFTPNQNYRGPYQLQDSGE